MFFLLSNLVISKNKMFVFDVVWIGMFRFVYLVGLFNLPENLLDCGDWSNGFVGVYLVESVNYL